MQSVCFPLYIAADDRVRLLTKPEKADFAFHFCPLAAMNRRQPGVIPAMPVPMLAKKLGLDKKVVLKRLVRLSSPGIELIGIEYDAPDENGELTLLSSVRVEILDFAEWNGLDDDLPESPFSSEGEGQSGPGTPPQNGTRQSDVITRNSNAERQARYRARNGQGRRSTDSQNGNGGQNGNSNAFSAQSNASALQNGAEGVTISQNGAPQNGESNASGALRPSRAGDDNDQRYGLDLNSKNSNTDSETLIVTNVGNASPVTPQSIPPQSQSIPPQSQSVTPLRPQPPKSPAPNKTPPPNLRGKSLAAQSVALCLELRDRGSEARHYQLLAVCEENNLPDLPSQALTETRRRMNNRSRGEVEKPGAYYTTALLRRLGEHNVHVPTKAELEAEPASEVQRLIQESIQATLPASYTPLEEPPEFEEPSF